MDNATHILYRRCTECPEARRKLQRMASVADRVAYVRDHYHTLYDEEVVRAQRPFAYRVGQWYTKRLHLVVHLDTVHLRANVRVTARIDDGRYVDREQQLVNDRQVAPHQLVERVERALRACLETFDDDVIMYGVVGVDERTRTRVLVETVDMVRDSLATVLDVVKRNHRQAMDGACAQPLPHEVHSLIGEYLYGV